MAISKKVRPMTKGQTVTELAERTGLAKKEVVVLLDTLVNTAIKHSKEGFTIPGLGKLVLIHRKARKGRNPATGESIKIKAKNVLKFKIAKAAKDAILG
jgi:DNA-binding protein HU-beta